MNRWVGGRIDERMDRRTDRWMDGWMDLEIIHQKGELSEITSHKIGNPNNIHKHNWQAKPSQKVFDYLH